MQLGCEPWIAFWPVFLTPAPVCTVFCRPSAPSYHKRALQIQYWCFLVGRWTAGAGFAVWSVFSLWGIASVLVTQSPFPSPPGAGDMVMGNRTHQLTRSVSVLWSGLEAASGKSTAGALPVFPYSAFWCSGELLSCPGGSKQGQRKQLLRVTAVESEGRRCW